MIYDLLFIIFNFHEPSDTEVYTKDLRTKINKSEIFNSIVDPTIIHYILCHTKMWKAKTKYAKSVTKCKERKNCSCLNTQKLWYSYANQTGYYKEIVKFYRIKSDIQKAFDNLRYL